LGTRRQEQEEDEVKKNWNKFRALAGIIGYQEWEWQADGAMVGTGLRKQNIVFFSFGLLYLLIQPHHDRRI